MKGSTTDDASLAMRLDLEHQIQQAWGSAHVSELVTDAEYKKHSILRKTYIGHPRTTEFANVHATTAGGSGQSGGPPTPDRTDGGQLQLS